MPRRTCRQGGVFAGHVLYLGGSCLDFMKMCLLFSQDQTLSTCICYKKKDQVVTKSRPSRGPNRPCRLTGPSCAGPLQGEATVLILHGSPRDQWQQYPPGASLDTRDLWFLPRPTGQEAAFQQDFQVIWRHVQVWEIAIHSIPGLSDMDIHKAARE